MKFVCPQCGNQQLVEIMEHVTVESDCMWTENFGIEYVSSTPINSDGEIEGYYCKNGHRLITVEKTHVQNEEELEDWLKLHTTKID